MKDLLLKFFESDYYAGWRNIAEALIKNGTCIVPGSECIWSGGIGNWIKTQKTIGAIDCLTYTFDLEEFKKSAWFLERKDVKIADITRQIEELNNKLKELE